MRLSVLSIVWLSSGTRALTLPSLPSMYLNGDISAIDQGTLLQYNLSSGRDQLGDEWTYNVEWGKTQLCVTALFVNAGNVLAIEAVRNDDVSVSSQTYTSVKKFEEVGLKISAYSDGLLRSSYLTTIYTAICEMKRNNSFVASRWTIFKNRKPMGRLDFTAGSGFSRSCGLDLADSLTLQSPASNNYSTAVIATTDHTETSASTLSLGTESNDDDPNMRVDFAWVGTKIDPFASLMAPIAALAKEPFAAEGIHRPAAYLHYIVIPEIEVTFIARVTGPNAIQHPEWTTYRVVKALGRFPYAMADKETFDWREVVATVKVNDVAVGTIAMRKGLLPSLSSSLPSGNNRNLTIEAKEVSEQ